MQHSFDMHPTESHLNAPGTSAGRYGARQLCQQRIGEKIDIARAGPLHSRRTIWIAM
jgi:hypothetical protein